MTRQEANIESQKAELKVLRSLEREVEATQDCQINWDEDHFDSI